MNRANSKEISTISNNRKCNLLNYLISYLEYVLWNKDEIDAAKSQLGKAKKNVDYIPKIDFISILLIINTRQDLCEWILDDRN